MPLTVIYSMVVFNDDHNISNEQTITYILVNRYQESNAIL